MVDVPAVLGYVGSALQAILLVLLLRGPISAYLPLFLFTATLFVTSILEGWVLASQGRSSDAYFEIFFVSEFLIGTLLFLMLVTLTQRAAAGNPALSAISKFQYAVIAAVYVLPFVLFEGEPFTSPDWNARAVQMMNFGGAIVALGLWTAVLIARLRDRQFLLVVAGLGAAFAGSAISLGIRTLAPENPFAIGFASYALQLCAIGEFALWCWAFGSKKFTSAAPTEPSAQADS